LLLLTESPLDKSVEWLLEGPSWVQYRTRIDLLGQPDSDKSVAAARQAMLHAPNIKSLLVDLSGWPGSALKRHNNASHMSHKLVFVADMGVRAGTLDVDGIIKSILSHQSGEGAFQVVANVSPRYGGSGTDQLAWMLCDSPSILYSLMKLGARDNPAVKSAAGHLASISFVDGWPCTVAPEFGKFRGPGRKADPCPCATLISLKALAQLPEWRDSEACKAGSEALLKLWEQRKERRPYMFAMGTDFAKLKAPLVWYGLLHVLEVLSQFPSLRKDKRLLEMADVMKAKSNADG